MGDSHGGKSSHVDKDSSRMFSVSLFVNGMTIATRVFGSIRVPRESVSLLPMSRTVNAHAMAIINTATCPEREREDSGISFRERFSVIRKEVPACVDAAKSTVE